MRPEELRTVGALQFLVSPELKEMLEQLPRLLRRLSTTTTSEEEWSADRIRGSIQWGRTIGLRYATGMPNLYVTAPSRRAYQTPENELLTFLLDETVRLGRWTGWYQSASQEIGSTIRAHVDDAQRLRQSRMLVQVERRHVTPRQLARIRAGRYRHRYRSVINAWDRYRGLVRDLDRRVIQSAVETHGLVVLDDPTLFELVCTFDTFNTLRQMGWKLGRLGLFAGSLRLQAVREAEKLEITYQATPKKLSAGSVYRAVLVTHTVSPGSLRPDLVLKLQRDGQPDRWILIEAKGGERSISKSARAATYDLLAYRSAFAPAITAAAEGPYGLGIAWGKDLTPKLREDIVLCSPDTLRDALSILLNG
jgi:hypothetical protein